MGGGGLNSDQPTENELHRQLHRYFELGTVYTMIAGLLNILAIYDAWGGPVFSEPAKKEDDEEAETEEGEADAVQKEDAAENAETDTANEPAPDAAAEDNASDEKE